MSKNKHLLFKVAITLLLISLFAACAPAATTQAPTTSAPVVTNQAATSSVPATASAVPAKPEGVLEAAVQDFGNENFLPWLTSVSGSIFCMLVYDMLIYYDEVNLKFIPGLAETWEVSSDALTTTYHLKKGIQFSDGWGEFTSADVKYSFEMQASKFSVGKVSATRNIESMDTPDPYTLVVHFKKPAPTFFGLLSLGDGGICQGIVCKKYIETVGEDAASQKPIGTGPYRLVDFQSGSYYTLEALDSHWRVVPEFKTLNLRLVPEVGTRIAMLKNKEIDLAFVTAEQMADLKASGIAVELSPHGGNIIAAGFGGNCIPADSRYDPAYHNQDPWTDIRVREAMTISIDRDAINKAIFAGAATPVGVPLIWTGMEKYKYPYDPARAKQLLVEAGYPNGFTFKAMSYSQPGVPEMPRMVEALASYWQQIGLKPEITVIDYAAYATLRQKMKMANEISLWRIPQAVDMLDKSFQNIMPGGMAVLNEDEGSYAIWKEGSVKQSFNERGAYVEKLNQYYFENYGPIPVLRTAYCFGWNPDKILPFPHASPAAPLYLEYVRHAKPLNTFRAFDVWPGR